MTDSYSLKARVYPCAIVLLPCFFLLMHYVSNIEAYYHYFSSALGIGLLSFLLAQLGRDRGKRMETDLFKLWGGMPTTIILRHSNNYLDVHTKKRFHDKLEQTIPGIKIPSEEEEKLDLNQADSVYISCSKALIAKTRDEKKYPLLHKENINYGFRRNLWGMKLWAIALLFACICMHCLISTENFTSLELLKALDFILLATFIGLILFWVFVVNANWVKTTAFAYAEQLHETLHH